jgi:2-oxoglutarate ferredoxin oxidoreductase subunit delta
MPCTVTPRRPSSSIRGPLVEETSKIRVTRFVALCKSCGECVMKCPVNAISWDAKRLGMLGEPAIWIDLDKCIGCGTCERVCPDSAVAITNKRLSSSTWQKGLLGWIVGMDAHLIELAASTFRADPQRLKRFGRTSDKTWIARVVRFLLRYPDAAITKYYED